MGGRGVFAPRQPEFDNLPIPTLPNEGEMICKGGSKIFDWSMTPGRLFGSDLAGR